VELEVRIGGSAVAAYYLDDIHANQTPMGKIDELL
jgi:hypothetical protein